MFSKPACLEKKMLDTLIFFLHNESMKTKTIKHKPYSKTSYLPTTFVIHSNTSHAEFLHIIDLYKKEVSRLQLNIEHQQKIIEHQQKMIDELTKEKEHLQAVIHGQKQTLFGRSSEKLHDSSAHSEAEEIERTEDLSGSVVSTPSAKPRGGRPGHKGHGRKIPTLPEMEVTHEIPDEQKSCPHCGQSYTDTGLTEDSYEIDIEIRFIRRKHIRKRAVKTCSCAAPKFLTAPKPPQVIPKGKFSHAFIAYILTMKYMFQVPLHRIVHMMRMHGLDVTESTIIGIFSTLHTLLTPLYEQLKKTSQTADHWHVDETGWKIFSHTENKQTFNWWLWVFVSNQTVLFVLDPSRAATVPLTHFGTEATGIVSSDRYRAYSKVIRETEGLISALCWAHIRRDFNKAGIEYVFLKGWADRWMRRIGELYHLNDERLTVCADADLFSQAQSALEKALDRFVQDIQEELRSPDLHARQRKVLSAVLKHWEALTVFARHPHVPMDNNTAERSLRPAALGRKNYYGCHAEWSGTFAALCMSILQTATLHGLNAEAYVRYILDILALHQGSFPDTESILPWNLPESVIQTYNMRLGGTL